MSETETFENLLNEFLKTWTPAKRGRKSAPGPMIPRFRDNVVPLIVRKPPEAATQARPADMTLMRGDCLDQLKTLRNGIVDAVITDPPFATTQLAWDTEFPIDLWFQEIFRVCRPDAPIIIFSAQPFTSRLIAWAGANYRYSWFWKKNRGSMIQCSGKQPIRKIEEIAVFYRHFREYHPPAAKFDVPRKYRIRNARSALYGSKPFTKAGEYYEVTHETQTNVLEFDVVSKHDKLIHTQKPIDLVKFLLETYTKPNDLVLDSFVGSGTTGAACIELNRKFIGIERDETHWKIAANRISK